MKYLVCNFKNKLTKDEIIKYNKNLGNVETKTELVMVPSQTYLGFFDQSGYSLGSQDISSFTDKTITGEVTGEQLKSLGVKYVIVGHSERRDNLREINIDFINKINNAHANNLKVIYCIGESLKTRENNKTYDVLAKEIVEVLNNVELKNIIIAYEPVWAIGTGKSASIKDIEDAVSYIKDIIEEQYEIKIEVLYGGSVNENNIKDLATIKCIDGFLVGKASLDVKSVLTMLNKIE